MICLGPNINNKTDLFIFRTVPNFPFYDIRFSKQIKKTQGIEQSSWPIQIRVNVEELKSEKDGG